MTTTRLVLVVLSCVLCLSVAASEAEAGALADGLILQDVFPEREPARRYTHSSSGSGIWKVPADTGWRPSSAMNVLAVPHAFVPGDLAAKLKLTDEQKRKLADALRASQAKVEPLKSKVSAAAEELRKALLSPESDASSLQGLVHASHKAEADLTNAELSAWLKIKSLLTDAQLKSLYDIAGRPLQLERTPTKKR